MGAHTVVAIYRPVKGREADLDALVRDHVPTLRRLGLATDAPVVVLRSPINGMILEIFDWKDDASVEAAHAHPEVLALWDRFDAVSDFATPASLAEAETVFPQFERLVSS